MRQTRTFVGQALSPGNELVLDPRAGEHLARVLRMRAGEQVVLFNGDGHDYPSTLLACDRRQVRARVEARIAGHGESPLDLVLAQALVATGKMDLVIQKAVELGVKAIVPVVTERCSVRLDTERAERRLERWRSVIISACEQCGRSVLPDISPPQALPAWCSGLADSKHLRLALLPAARQRIRDLQIPAEGLILVVGPEGGLSPDDMDLLHAAGFAGLALGPRVLRTETAGMAALAAIQATYGDG